MASTPTHNHLNRSNNSAKSLMPLLSPPTSVLLAGTCNLVTGLDEFQAASNNIRRPQPIRGVFDYCPARHTTSEASDEWASHHQSSKKKRLSGDQVKSLESCFDSDSRLDPDRKNQLACELGLQPKQVAVWFQNKRARSKMKHFELKYDALKADYQLVLAENAKLEAEVARLRELLDSRPNAPETKTTTEDEESADTASDMAYEHHCDKHEAAELFENKDGSHEQQKELPKEMPKEHDEDDEEAEETIEDEDETLEEAPAETESESAEMSCGTAQSEALDASSPTLCNDDQQMTQEIAETHACMQHNFYVDQRLPCNQQHYFLQQFQYLHSLNNDQLDQLWFFKEEEQPANIMMIQPSLPELDQVYSNFPFGLEDIETPTLWCDPATQG